MREEPLDLLINQDIRNVEQLKSAETKRLQFRTALHKLYSAGAKPEAITDKQLAEILGLGKKFKPSQIRARIHSLFISTRNEALKHQYSQYLKEQAEQAEQKIESSEAARQAAEEILNQKFGHYKRVAETKNQPGLILQSNFKVGLFALFEQGFTPENISYQQLGSILGITDREKINTRVARFGQGGVKGSLKHYFKAYQTEKLDPGKK